MNVQAMDGGGFMATNEAASEAASAAAQGWVEGGGEPITEQALQQLDTWWRAANYLSIGQIYLLDNPLLRRPLTRDDVKPRLLGHWGTTPGLNFVYAHLNRVIQERSLST